MKWVLGEIPWRTTGRVQSERYVECVWLPAEWIWCKFCCWIWEFYWKAYIASKPEWIGVLPISGINLFLQTTGSLISCCHRCGNMPPTSGHPWSATSVWDLPGEICCAGILHPLRFWAPGVLRAVAERAWASLSLGLVLVCCTKPFAFGLKWQQIQESWTRGQPLIPRTVFPNWVTLQLRDSLPVRWEHREQRMLCLKKFKWSRLHTFCHPVMLARKKKQRRKNLPCHPLSPDRNPCCLLPRLCTDPISMLDTLLYGSWTMFLGAERTCIRMH